MNKGEPNWKSMAEVTKTTSQAELEKTCCPSCGGALLYVWTPPPRHGAISIRCMACFEGISKTTDDMPVWADPEGKTKFETVTSNS